MKTVVLVWLFSCSFGAYANIAPITRDYTGQIDSFFKTGNDIYSLSGTTTNGYIDEYSTTYPYGGGMAINREDVIMSSDSIRIATLFPHLRYPSARPACWASGTVEGSIEIEDSSQYPIGTPLELKIDYGSVEIGNTSSYFLDKGAVLVDESFGILWYADHSTDGDLETFTVEITSGEKYFFYMWQDFGTEKAPVIANYSALGSGVAIDISVIPEPATLLLLGLGGLVLRRRRA